MAGLNKIRFVKETTQNGMPYKWFVSYKNGDSAEYIHYENGKTVARYYGYDSLPCNVKLFVRSSIRRIWSEHNFGGENYITYIYEL